MSRREYDFWHSAELRSRLGTGSVYGIPEVENLVGRWIDKYVSPVRDRLKWLAGGSEIAPGVDAIDAPGHTPGTLGNRDFLPNRIAAVRGRPVAFTEPGCASGLDLDVRSGCTDTHRNASPVAGSCSNGSQHRLPLPFRRCGPLRKTRRAVCVGTTHLAKPVHPTDLLRKIRTFWSRDASCRPRSGVATPLWRQ
jgi:hypothetical protein